MSGEEHALFAIVAALACGLLWTVVIAGAWLAFASERRRRRSPRTLLDRRLALGEISVEEYYERESALRTSEPPQRRRALLLR